MIYLKRGDTLTLLITRKDSDGLPLTGEASKLSSQIRDNNDLLIGSFIITETLDLGTYLFMISSNLTQDFPTSTLYFDIEYDDGVKVESSDTIMLLVKKDVTI